MGDSTMTLQSLIIYAIISTATCLTLPYQEAKPTRHTKYSSSTAAPLSGSLVTPANAPITPTSGVSIYRLLDSKGSTCILMKTDGIIEIKFLKQGEEEQVDSYLPDRALVEGNCKSEDEQTLRISWNGYLLILNFMKTPGGELWYITRVELLVSTDHPHLQSLNSYGKTLTLVHDKMLIPTPVGKSYACSEVEVALTTREGDNLPSDLRGTLFLRMLQTQPFMYKGNDFGPEFECKSAIFRDETAPIAVGSTLAIAVLLTVTGYGVFRYFKIKKVQYNTME